MSHLHTNDPRSSSTSGMKPLALALAIAVGASLATECTTAAASATPRADGSIVWVVENCNDAGDGSLRDVAFHAHDGDAIDLSGLTCGTISVTTGAITLPDVELIGPGAGKLEIDGLGNGGRRIFNHSGGGGTLSISGLTIKRGLYFSHDSQGGGCLRSTDGNLSITDSVFSACAVVTPVGQAGYARGGAIISYGTFVHLYGTTIESSLAQTDHIAAEGGGLFALGNVSMQTSTISNNTVSAANGSVGPPGSIISGGGLVAAGSVWIENSTLDGNKSFGDSGAAWVSQGGTLLNSTVSHNVAHSGIPGIDMDGNSIDDAHIYSSTISGNVSEHSEEWISGALSLNTTNVTIANSTITGNSETNEVGTMYGAGIVFSGRVVNVTMSGTIVSGNYFDDGGTSHAADDIGGPASLTILGDTNLVGWSRYPLPADTIWASDPKLGPLQDNGGPTWTHLPLPDSPAIDHGAAHGFDTDQRGFARIVGTAADIGSVEWSNDVIFIDGFDQGVVIRRDAIHSRQ